VQFEQGPGQCPDPKCPYSHTEKDMVAFRDSQIKRLVKSPYSHGTEQLIDAIRSVQKSISTSHGQNRALLEDSNISEDQEVSVHPISKTDS
jgi:hypothetical protein